VANTHVGWSAIVGKSANGMMPWVGIGGGKDWCDPADPRCGPNGRLQETTPIGQPIPEPVANITHVSAIQLEIGCSGQEVGALNLGWYGNVALGSVQEFLDLYWIMV